MIWEIIGGMLLLLLLAIAAYVDGYNDGTRHTEKRWSDAVGRRAAGEPVARVTVNTGRLALKVGPVFVAVETDPCRDPNLIGNQWDDDNLKAAMRIINDAVKGAPHAG